MKRLILLPLIALVLVFSLSLPVAAQSPAGPPAGWQAHPPIHARPFATSSPTGYSPSQIRTAYGFDQINGDGTGQTIAIIDAYDDPTVESDLQVFSDQFGLPAMNTTGGPTFTKVYAQGRKPRTDSGWALEISLDVQWAHAIAPGANILLVEAATNSFSNLLGAVDKAVSMGADVVSMSWGGSEFSGESIYDYHFNKPGVVFTASSGDNGAGVIYPAVSPYVLGIGGTSLTLKADNTINSETAWSGSGGGISRYESEPGYQIAYDISSGGRGVPDVSYDADPNTGFSVYDSTSYQGQSGWWQVGGTSAGAPQWAALVAIADQGLSKPLSTSDLTSSPFYNAATGVNYADNYHDIIGGSNGIYTAVNGYDFVTGLGSPIAYYLVPFLSGGTTGNTSPTISSFTPTSGGAGTTVTITGTNFTEATKVTFGDTDAYNFTVNSSGTNITATVGNGSTGKISVTTPYGTAISSDTFTYIATTSLSVTVSTNKGAYKVGDTAYITVIVTSGGLSVDSAAVTVDVINSSGTTISTLNGNTDSGTALFTFKTTTKGTYTLNATATTTNSSGSGSTKFRVH